MKNEEKLVLGSWFLVLGSWFFEGIGAKALSTKHQAPNTKYQAHSSFFILHSQSFIQKGFYACQNGHCGSLSS